jgi:Helix-turn-helix domain/Protein of unknown function (DUF2914)
MTLAAVAERTRISPHHLDALERSDLDALPAGPFGRSYIRSYAEVLGIDPAPILEAYHFQEVQRGVGTPEGDRRMLQELSHLVGRGGEAGGPLARLRARPVGLAAAAVVSVVILLSLGWLLGRGGARQSPPKSAPPTAVTVPAPTPIHPPETGPRSRPGRLTPSPAAGVAPPPPQPAERPAAPPTAGGAGQPTKPLAARLPTDSLQVSDFGVGSDVVDHRLVGRADRFPGGMRVFFWTLVVGGQPGQVVRHVWFQGGRAVMRTDLPVGGSHWRTRSSQVLPDGCAGPWTVEARTSDGRLLARNDFVCEPRRSR